MVKSYLSDYVKNLKIYIKENKGLKEEEIVRYVYLDLGKKFCFDENFFFGKSAKKHIYFSADNFYKLDDAFKNYIITCRSASKILNYILSAVGIKIEVVIDCENNEKCPHVYNVITPKDGSKKYIIDLQDDMIYIHFHEQTKNFGLSLDKKSYVVSLQKQKYIDEKLGYISKQNPYNDEYIDLLKYYLEMFDDEYEKIDFLLKNIDPVKLYSMQYWERRWNHDRLLEHLLGKETQDKIRIIEFFKKDENSKRTYINGFYVNTPFGVLVYLYSDKDYCYNSYTIDEYAKLSKEENIINRQKISGLGTALLKLKSNT